MTFVRTSSGAIFGPSAADVPAGALVDDFRVLWISTPVISGVRGDLSALQLGPNTCSAIYHIAFALSGGTEPILTRPNLDVGARVILPRGGSGAFPSIHT
jgi:hypothetical protein